MSVGSTLDPDSGATPGAMRPRGHDTASLGPGDRSDTGSGSVGATGLDPAILADDGDASGTGVAASPADPAGAPRDMPDQAFAGGTQPPDGDPEDGAGPIGDVERVSGGAGPGDRYAGDAPDDPDAVGGPQDDPDAAQDDPPQRGSIERGPREP